MDPIALGIPTYFDIIKEPMDFATITQKLNEFKYTEVSEFIYDMRLVFKNAIKFNPPDSIVFMDAQTLLGIFEKSWVKPRTNPGPSSGPKVGIVRTETGDGSLELTPQGTFENTSVSLCIKRDPLVIKNNLERLLNKLRDHKDAPIFLYPVDPIIYPDYHSIIQNPIDLHTIGQRLDQDVYMDELEFIKDVQSMFDNCLKFKFKFKMDSNSIKDIDDPIPDIPLSSVRSAFTKWELENMSKNLQKAISKSEHNHLIKHQVSLFI